MKSLKVARLIAKPETEGRAEGREEGREEGRAEGAQDEKKATARRLLAMGLSAEQVTAATQLSLDEIKKL